MENIGQEIEYFRTVLAKIKEPTPYKYHVRMWADYGTNSYSV